MPSRWLVQPQAVFQRGDERLPLLAAAERAGADHGEPAGDLLPAGTGQQPGPFDVDACVSERHREPFGEVLEGVGRLGAVPGAEADVVDLVHAYQGGGGVEADAADGFQHVGDVGAAGQRQAEEPGELDRDHPRGRGRRGGDVDDGDMPGRVRVAAVVHRLDGLAELGQAGRLPGAGRPGQDQAAPAGVGVPVQVLQPASLDDHLLDGGSGDGQQPGVVGEPGLVVVEPGIVVQELPGGLGQQVRDGGPGRDELAPAAQRGQLPCAAVSAGRAGCLLAGQSRSPALVRFGERVEDLHRDDLRQRRVLVR